MKAAFIVAPRKFEIRDVPMPKISNDEMLVKIAACGVCSSDMPGYLDSVGEEMKKRMPFPRRAGHEPSGTVVEVGKNVKGFKAGDRITGFWPVATARLSKRFPMGFPSNMPWASP
jgi:D-arabinose 1-dehydrogenase-like Zn-dependent alcohol dehydrogenase